MDPGWGVPGVTLGTVAADCWGAVPQLLTLRSSAWETHLGNKMSWLILMFLLLMKLKTDALVEVTPVRLGGRLVGVQSKDCKSGGFLVFFLPQ